MKMMALGMNGLVVAVSMRRSHQVRKAHQAVDSSGVRHCLEVLYFRVSHRLQRIWGDSVRG